MKTQTNPWNSIRHFSVGRSIIGIVVLYDDYFDCYTDFDFKFGEGVDYNTEVLKSLKFCKLNNAYSNYRESYKNNEYIQLVAEEFIRPLL